MLIQKMRLQHGWSQQQLAEASGLSTRTVQRIEAGHPASTESLKSLAAVFGVEWSTLNPEPAMTTQANPADPTFPDVAAVRADLGSTANVAARIEREERDAFAHVRRLRGFYLHLSKYLMVVSVLVIVNLVTAPHRLWVLWVIAGWGIGLLFHASRVFRPDWLLGAAWERAQVEKRLGRPLS
jgi:transcriptional regulator with XRE-family HTH domain